MAKHEKFQEVFGKYSEAIGIEDLRKEKINIPLYKQEDENVDTYNEEAMIG